MAKRAWEASSSSERWPPEVLPKHTIFLSHSGQDKPFVERLCEKLENLNHSPFFDQNSDSLPKGERFPPHLFKAAEQCLLAVIVLSEGYLTSKWPMLELAAFVKARETKNPHMKLLPLFYKLSPSDLVPEKWMESWKKLAEEGKIPAQEIDSWSKGVEVLMNAKNVETKRLKSLTEHDEQDEIMRDDFSKLLGEVVQDLRPFNGLVFSKYGTSEGRYIEVVVDEIFKTIPPVMKYSPDGIRGYQRMCERASSLFEEGSLTNDVSKPGCSYLGLYGMGGVGKTTLCEAMCSFYEVEFRGRVYHVELQSDAPGERIERLKRVLRQLGGLDDRAVEKINGESQVWQCLKGRLKTQPPAFFAVDNVGDSESSRHEARKFISCGLACGSKVMVTSRSRSILESVLREAKYCKPVPRLEEHEAEELFLSVAIPQKMSSPLLPGEEEIVKACLQECTFLDDGYVTHQYHPLVLRALGTFFHDVDKDGIMEWKEALMLEKKLHVSRESKRVNGILGLNYANLSDGQKLLFLDVVFMFNLEKFSFQSIESWSSDGIRMGISGASWNSMLSIMEFEWALPVLAAAHKISTFELKFRVKELQRKSLIYESTLRTHDLYIEFAQSLVAMEGSKEKEWWVGHKDANGGNPSLRRLIFFNDAATICRPSKQLWECPNLECLIMQNCKVSLKPKLDLKGCTNLRLLMITDGYDYSSRESSSGNTMEILCTSDDAVDSDHNIYGWKDQSKGCLPELRMVKLCGFDLRRIPFLGQCWNLTYLSVYRYIFDSSDFLGDGTSIFQNLKALETLILVSSPSGRVSSCQFDGLLRGVTKLRNLKFLEIDLRRSSVDGGGFSKLDLGPLGRLTSLQTLSLPRLPYGIKELIGLDQLSQLSELNLKSSYGLQKLPNLDLLPNLQRISVLGCRQLELPKDQLKRFQEPYPLDYLPHLEQLSKTSIFHKRLLRILNYKNVRWVERS